MGKILGIDFGMKRSGIAISNEDKDIAFGRQVLETAILEDYLADLFTQEKIDTVVLGLPVNLSGQDSDQTTQVRFFADFVKRTWPSVEVVLWDERYSTKAASDLIGNMPDRDRKSSKKLIDMLSAVYILQGYLDRH